MSPTRKARLIILSLLLVLTVGCDQATKAVARRQLRENAAVSLPGSIGELRLAENPGAFLSLGVALPEWARVGIFTAGVGAGLTGLMIYLLIRPHWFPSSFAGAALVASGGASNVIDRLTQHGLVTDFITLRCGPLHTGVFNFADMMVMAGIVSLLFSRWKVRSPGKAAANPESRDAGHLGDGTF